MARKPRVEYPGAFYHVITRGNQRRDIFTDSRDRERCINKLKDYKERYEFFIYAYTLMSNHIHLLIETGNTSLSKIMQGFLQSYTQYYNRKYNTVGHLFQSRYKAILCDKDAYLLQLVRYIHLNPVRAKIVENSSDYLWSSHRVYLGLEGTFFIDYEFVLGQFSNRPIEARRMYENFILDGLKEERKEEYSKGIAGRFLGDKDFIADIKKRFDEEPVLKNKTLQEVIKMVKQVTGLGESELKARSRGKKEVKARNLFVYLSLLYTDASRMEIARLLCRDPKMVTHLEKQFQEKEWKELDTIMQDGVRNSRFQPDPIDR